MRYGKPPLSVEDQLRLLVRRGMAAPDPDRARHYLTHINYYRLRAYWLPLEQDATGGVHRFTPGTSFEDVLSLYVFDRRLRLLVMDAVERTSRVVPTGGRSSLPTGWTRACSGRFCTTWRWSETSVRTTRACGTGGSR